MKDTSLFDSTRSSRLALSGLFLSASLGVAACSDEPLGESVGTDAAEALAPEGAEDGVPEVLFTRVHFLDDADLQHLATSLDLLEDADRSAGWVGALLAPERYGELLAEGRRVDVISREPVITTRSRPPSGIPDFPCYRTVEETHQAMRTIAEGHPELAKVVDIGDSWTKVTNGGSEGYDLLVLKLTSGAVPGPKPAFFLMGAIHAREYVTAETAMRFAEQMVNGYGTNPDATWLLDNYELHILPQANPDGRKLAEEGYYQRKNRNDKSGGGCWGPPTPSSQSGTDLNRNSTFRWGSAGSSTMPCNQMFRGKSAGSEPETQAIQGYLSSIFPDHHAPTSAVPAPADKAGIFLSLHSYGPNVLYPWAWTSSGAPNGVALATLGRKFGYFNGYAVCQPSTCIYAASGSTDDWSYGTLGIASFTFEMGTTFFESCSSFESTVAPKNLPAILYAFKAARRPYQAPAGPDSLKVSVSKSAVAAGASVTLSATADDTRYASNGKGEEPTQAIAAARYSVDHPSWVASTSTVAMKAADGAFNASREGVTATISTAGWAKGRHLILVESRDVAGNWGVPSSVFLDIN